MIAPTLEEIEELAREATPGPWTTKGKSVKAVGSPSVGTAPNGWQGGICNCMGSGHGPRSRIDELAERNAALIAALPDLLAIAQGQRGELERLRSNASTAAFDKVNDQLREANEDNRILSERLGSAVKTIHGMDGELFLLKEIETILQKLPQDVFGGAFWEQLERIRRHREGIGTKK